MPSTGLRIRRHVLPAGIWNFPLQVHVGVFITALLVVFGTTMVVFNYQRDRSAGVVEAERVFDGVSAHAISEIRALFGPVQTLVELSVHLPGMNREALAQRWTTVPYLVEALRATPTVSAIFCGHADGSFFLVRATRGNPRIHAATAAPGNAAFVVQSIDRVDGAMQQVFHYLDEDLVLIGEDRRFRTGYDPRRRRWYRDALLGGETTLTPVYVFATTNELGTTMSRALPGGGAVVGVDMSLDSYAHDLDALKIGERGRVVILTDNGRVAVSNDPDALLDKVRIRPDGSSMQPLASELNDPVLAATYGQYRQRGEGGTFLARVGEEEWLARYTRLSLAGTAFTLGIIAPGQEFLAESERARTSNLLVSLAMFLGALPLAWLIGRQIARPIHALTEETGRIRRFDLEGDRPIPSHVREVLRLSDSMHAMKRSLRDFGRFMPRQLVRDLVTGRASATLGGERREISLLFTDIANFTALAENLDPGELMTKTSDYLEHVGRVIIEHRGTIDKYMGDAIMAFWNAPEEQRDHAAMMCQAALAAAAASRAFDQELAARGEPVMFTRFGLHLGTAVVGNVGSVDRMDYTVLGAMVNLGSRIEGLNKVYGTQILVSDAVRERVRQRFVFRPVDYVVPKGATAAVPVHELVGSRQKDSPHAVDAERLRQVDEWTRVHALYLSRDWEALVEEIARFAERWPNDPVAPIFLERARHYRETPPPANWDGAEIMTRK